MHRDPQAEYKEEVLASLSERAGLLREAEKLVCGDRNNQYGPPHQDFARTAALWTSLGFTFEGKPVEAHHIALAMVLLKTSRLAWQPEKFDSWTDVAGYASCGWECVVEEATGGTY